MTDVQREAMPPIAGRVNRPRVSAPHRGPALGSRYAVATDHQAASIIGMEVLRRGGSAIDATIAVAAVNVVTKPDRTHLGGDAFALLWDRETDAVECLNAGGRASRHATPERFAEGIPARGPAASTVPGLVDSWVTLHHRHGRLPFAELLAPAIELCEDGFPVTSELATRMAGLAESGDASAQAAFLDGGNRPYAPGERYRQPELAETLRAVSADGRDGFYAGRVGSAIAAAMREGGGLIDEEDLAEPTALWSDPISIDYRGYTVYEQALPSQGIILLQALNIAEQFPLAEWELMSPDAVHVLVEAVRLAFNDRRRYVGDPLVEDVPVDRLLSKDHARELAANIDMSRATARSWPPRPGDTTSFVVADERMAVSYIQSVFSVWGSSFVVPGTGVLMNNRMRGFFADPQSPNRIAPRKRAVHTLNTFLVVRDGRLIVGGCTPGADFQVQDNLQTITGVLDWQLDLQSAVDMPRWVSMESDELLMESRFAPETFDALQARGHQVRHGGNWNIGISRTQVVASLPEGGWACASDLRGEGAALAY